MHTYIIQICHISDYQTTYIPLHKSHAQTPQTKKPTSPEPGANHPPHKTPCNSPVAVAMISR